MIRIVGNLIGKDVPFNNIGIRQKRASERLSSGKKINHAADDVAGIAISQTMEAQIRGLEKAERNALDGISLIQTADGALSTVHDILNRMVELTVQASNGIYTMQDREKMQKEINQLIEEIDHISSSTVFNEKKLLDGSLGDSENLIFSKTLSSTSGIEYKAAVSKGAKWEGSINLSEIKDGVILKINDTVYEFDSDGNTNTNGKIINFTPLSNSTLADLMKEIDDALQADMLGGKLQNIECSLGSGSNLNIKLNAVDNNVKHGELISVFMGSSIPEIDTTNQVIEEGEVIGPFVLGSKLTIKNIDLSKFVDGTMININGNIYEVDSDGEYDLAKDNVIFINDINDAVEKATKISDKLEELKTVCGFDSIGFWGDVNSGFEFVIKYEDFHVGDQVFDVKFNENKDKNFSVSVDDSKRGVNTPEIKLQQARKKELIDFSKVSDGSIFIIDGNKFEFDNDGVLSDPSNILVDISSSSSTSEMATAFKTAFDNSSIASDYILSISDTDEGKTIVEVSSSAASTFNGQRISMEYENVEGLRYDEVGLFLQVGSNSGGVNKMHLRIDSASASYLGVADVNVVSDEAMSNIENIYNAIDKVSVNRSNLGAAQNRLESIQKSLSITNENLSVSKSRITDADMAKELMELIKENVLEQSAQGILSMTMNFSKDTVQQLIQN